MRSIRKTTKSLFRRPPSSVSIDLPAGFSAGVFRETDGASPWTGFRASCLILICTVVGSGCDLDGSQPSHSEPGVYSGTRLSPSGGAWSDPSQISILSSVEGVQTFLLGLEPAADGLVLLLSTPHDPITNPAQRHALTVVGFDGDAWSIDGSVRGSSQFHRGSGLATQGVGLRLFWSGDPPDAVPPLPYPPEFVRSSASTIYTCKWRASRCEGVDSLSFPRRAFVSFSEIVDWGGNRHVAFEHLGRVFHSRVGTGGIEQLFVAGGTQPSLTALDNSLLIVLGGRGHFNRGFGLVTRRWSASVWSAPSIVYSDSSSSVERTAVYRDRDGSVHLAWMTSLGNGVVKLFHASSSDGAVNWTSPIEVFQLSAFFSRSPMFAEDRFGRLHLVWGHHDTPPKQRTFHAILLHDGWTEAEELFTSMSTTSTRKVAVDSKGDIHMVFQADSTFYHTIYR
ncbi:MAG: hypothetical protein ACI9BV_003907 [Rhodothermales bacterium]|jgi:hypothetical protein